MTTNQSLDKIRIVLEKSKKKDINIEIESIIDVTVNYLDVTIANENSYLRTCVYHKPTAQPYYLTYTSDYLHKYHRNILYTALICAERLCSNIYDFNSERLHIDMSLLLSQYPPKFISNQFLRFFQVNNAMPVFIEVNQQVYQRLPQQLLNRITEEEQILHDGMKDTVTNPAILEKKPWNRSMMYLRYAYEAGPPATFSNEFYSWWEKHYLYPGSKMKNIKLRLIPKTNRTLANYLIQKKRPRHILRITKESNKQ